MLSVQHQLQHPPLKRAESADGQDRELRNNSRNRPLPTFSTGFLDLLEDNLAICWILQGEASLGISYILPIDEASAIALVVD